MGEVEEKEMRILQRGERKRESGEREKKKMERSLKMRGRRERERGKRKNFFIFLFFRCCVSLKGGFVVLNDTHLYVPIQPSFFPHIFILQNKSYNK